MSAPCAHTLGPDSLGNPHYFLNEPGLYALAATCALCGATGTLPIPLRGPSGWPRSKCPGYPKVGHMPDARKDRCIAYDYGRHVMEVTTECGGCGLPMALRQPVEPNPAFVSWGFIG